jgi:hypothetical protein
MTKTYSEKHNAKRAAIKAHGPDGFALHQADGGWTFAARTILTQADADGAEGPEAEPENDATGWLVSQIKAREASQGFTLPEAPAAQGGEASIAIADLATSGHPVAEANAASWPSGPNRSGTAPRELRTAAWQLLSAWDTSPARDAIDSPISRAIETLRATLAAKAPRATSPRAPRQDRDWTIKPVITSPTNQVVARLVDKIEAARGNAAALAAFTFRPSNSYYAMAHRYLEALRAEAQG